MDESAPIELDTLYIHRLLITLRDNDVQEFEGGGIRIKFKKPAVVSEPASTDVRGFEATSDDDDSTDDELKKLAQQVSAEADKEKDLHRRTFGFRGMKPPTLAPDGE